MKTNKSKMSLSFLMLFVFSVSLLGSINMEVHAQMVEAATVTDKTKESNCSEFISYLTGLTPEEALDLEVSIDDFDIRNCSRKQKGEIFGTFADLGLIQIQHAAFPTKKGLLSAGFLLGECLLGGGVGALASASDYPEGVALSALLGFAGGTTFAGPFVVFNSSSSGAIVATGAGIAIGGGTAMSVVGNVTEPIAGLGFSAADSAAAIAVGAGSAATAMAASTQIVLPAFGTLITCGAGSYYLLSE